MYKQLLRLFLLAICLITPWSTYAQFSDVAGTHDFHDGIQYVRQKQIVQGYEDGTFRPAQTINRAEFSKIIIASQFSQSIIDDCVRLSKTVTDGKLFTDVPSDAWFAPYICVAKQHGIIQGYADGSFRPGQDIAFVEAAKIIVKTFGYAVNEQETPWYRPFVVKLEERAAIPQTVVSFEHTLQRGEMAEIVYRLMAQMRTKPSKSYTQLEHPQQEGNMTLQRSITISYKDLTRSTIVQSLKTSKTPHVLVEVSLADMNTPSFATTWNTFVTGLQKERITYGVILNIFERPCMTTADTCFAQEGRTGLVDGVQSAPLLTEIRTHIRTLQQGYTPQVLYLDPSLSRLYTGDPFGVVDIPVLLKAVTDEATIPVFATVMVEVSGEVPPYVYELEQMIDGLGVYVFPSIIGEVSREEMWSTVDGWLTSAKGMTVKPLHLVGTGFPTEIPFGSLTMQEKFSELVQTYMKHYGPEYRLISWYGLWDMTAHTDMYFRAMGLVDTAGNTREALHYWLP